MCVCVCVCVCLCGLFFFLCSPSTARFLRLVTLNLTNCSCWGIKKNCFGNKIYVLRLGSFDIHILFISPVAIMTSLKSELKYVKLWKKLLVLSYGFISIDKTHQKHCHASFKKSTKCVSCQLSPPCGTHVSKVFLRGKHFKEEMMTEVVCARSDNTFILKAAVSAMCNPPQPGDESYETFLKVSFDFHVLLLWFFFFFFFAILLQAQQVRLNALLPLIVSFSLFFLFVAGKANCFRFLSKEGENCRVDAEVP